MVTAEVTSLPNSFWSRRIRLTGFSDIEDPTQPLEVFDNLEQHLREPMDAVLEQRRAFKMKVEILFRVDIPSRDA